MYSVVNGDSTRAVLFPYCQYFIRGVLSKLNRAPRIQPAVAMNQSIRRHCGGEGGISRKTSVRYAVFDIPNTFTVASICGIAADDTGPKKRPVDWLSSCTISSAHPAMSLF